MITLVRLYTCLHSMYFQGHSDVGKVKIRVVFSGEVLFSTEFKLCVDVAWKRMCANKTL